jgi:hypothetical protein
MTAEKKKMGRPPKEKKGAYLWVPSEILDMTKAMIDTFRKQQRQQAQQ